MTEPQSDPLVAPVVGGTPEDESLRVAHARKQGHADGFQAGWHAALFRVREGDRVEELAALVPRPEPREQEPPTDDAVIKQVHYWLDYSIEVHYRDGLKMLLAIVERLRAVRPASAPSLEWLDEEAFYDLMQAYRSAPLFDSNATITAFEAVKRAIRDHLAASVLSRPLEETMRGALMKLDRFAMLAPTSDGKAEALNVSTGEREIINADPYQWVKWLDVLRVIDDRLRVLVPGGDPQEQQE